MTPFEQLLQNIIDLLWAALAPIFAFFGLDYNDVFGDDD